MEPNGAAALLLALLIPPRLPRQEPAAAPPASGASPPAFAIVAPAAWRGALEPFARARAEQWRVELVALEEVMERGAVAPAADAAANAPATADAPERLKRFLHAGWRERGLTHVLLVGDCDVLPVRFMVLDRATPAAADRAFYACDLYYADVARADGSFDDWNGADPAAGGDPRYFGEVRGETAKSSPINFDAISYVPELAVGRWPVSDLAALQAVIAKTLAWRPTGPAPRALALHADGWIDARPTVQALLDTLQTGGFTTARQFFGDADGVPTPASVSAAVNSGLDLLLHLGHGFPDGYDRCFGPAEVEATRTAHPAIWFSVGCNTASFCTEPPYQPYVDSAGLPHRGTNAGEQFATPPPPPACLQPGPLNATGIGERLLRHPTGGASAYLGCNTGAQPCAVTLMEGFVTALARPPSSGTAAASGATAPAAPAAPVAPGATAAAAPAPTLGEAWRSALAHYYAAQQLATLAPDAGWYPPSIFFQGMKFMLFGDPTLRVR
ncbi:MAG: hypothetical protein JNL90_20695 [Planctomycetes bacterium]|nr:hypothetical protein [Planctomycetota bacterium]